MMERSEVTKRILEIVKPDYTEKDLRNASLSWWKSVRKNGKGSWWLSETGFQAMKTAGIKDHFIRFDSPIFYTNKVIVWLDNYINCPFFIDAKGIYVFEERTAVQLVLFSGNVPKYLSAKALRDSG